MSLASVLNAGLSGLQVSQHGLRVASQNVANADTPGYVRAEVSLAPQIIGGDGSGVEVSAIRRAADKFLAEASYAAQSSSAAAGARADLLDRAQSYFGDPSSSDSVIGQLDRIFAGIEALAVEPSASTRQSEVVSSLQAFFGELSRISGDLEGLRQEADDRIAAKVSEVNSLAERIAAINLEIRAVRASGGDATGAENLQSQVIDELARLVDIEVAPMDNGGIEVRSARGMLLVGRNGATELRYAAVSAPFGSPNEIEMVAADGTVRALPGELQSGEIAGLIRTRDQDLAGLAESLGALAGAVADALNAAHNVNAAATPQAMLAGRQTGLAGGDLLNFTGTATFGVVGGDGSLLRRVEANFSAAPPTLSINGQAPIAITAAVPGAPTIAEFVSALDQAFDGAIGPDTTDLGDATFSGGRLQLSASGLGQGIVVTQGPGTESSRGGRGFGHFFGLNDLVTRPNPSIFETGLTGSEEGFGGGAITLRVRDASGRIVADRAVMPSATSITATISALNAVGTGIGPYAAFSAPDPVDGRVTLTTAAGYKVEVVSDASNRAGTGVSFTGLFGIGVSANASRARELTVRSDIASAPAKLATGSPDLSAAIGQKVLFSGDNRGAQALANAKDRVVTIPSNGVLASQTGTLSRYAAVLAGEVGRRASDSTRAQSAADAVKTAADERRSSREGVKLDDELIKMTRFQQSYSAAARIIQAAQDMFDTLLNVV